MKEIIVVVSLDGDNAPSVRIHRKRELFLELQEYGFKDEELETLSTRLDTEGTVQSTRWHDLFYYQLLLPSKNTVKISTKSAKKNPSKP